MPRGTTNQKTERASRFKRRGMLLLLALMGALFSFGCVTSTMITQVVQKEGGETLIGQTVGIEFNEKVWNAMEPADRTNMGDVLSAYQKLGWQVTNQDGGRISTATLA